MQSKNTANWKTMFRTVVILGMFKDCTTPRTLLN